MKHILIIFLSLSFFSSLSFACLKESKQVTVFSSVYTKLDESKCKLIHTIKHNEAPISEQLCTGINGYSLKIHDEDDRQSITVITPDKRAHALSYWSYITNGFSYLGQTAEWRIEKKGQQLTTPIALIVRVNDNEKNISYLAVAKITDEAICVVDKIPPQKLQNELARKSADNSAHMLCLSDKNNLQ